MSSIGVLRHLSGPPRCFRRRHVANSQDEAGRSARSSRGERELRRAQVPPLPPGLLRQPTRSTLVRVIEADEVLAFVVDEEEGSVLNGCTDQRSGETLPQAGI